MHRRVSRHSECAASLPRAPVAPEVVVVKLAAAPCLGLLWTPTAVRPTLTVSPPGGTVPDSPGGRNSRVCVSRELPVGAGRRGPPELRTGTGSITITLRRHELTSPTSLLKEAVPTTQTHTARPDRDSGVLFSGLIVLRRCDIATLRREDSAWRGTTPRAPPAPACHGAFGLRDRRRRDWA